MSFFAGKTCLRHLRCRQPHFSLSILIFGVHGYDQNLDSFLPSICGVSGVLVGRYTATHDTVLFEHLHIL